MGVDLGGGDGRVSEHSLHASDIRTILQEVGRETVTQGMRVDILHDTGLGRIVFHESLDAPWRQPKCLATTSFRIFRKGDEERRVDVVSEL